ncbi:MAG: 1-deoxy-D-xylulose-5-phosphate reductoisomerase, partial [Candidatus Nanopelagicales bacterium]
MRDVVILGSTGSIGTQALDVVDRNRDRFRVVALSAGGGNVALLADQARAFDVVVVGVADAAREDVLRAALADRGIAPKVLVGPEASTEIAGLRCDVVLNGMTGSIGL